MDVYDDLQKGSSRASARSTIKNTINGYITAASSGSRPEDMEVIVYRRICDNVTYDYDHVSDYDQSLYGGVLGLTVCTGYAKLFEAVMCKLGFECTLIENTTHAWNILKIHGQWYYVDTTWADQSWGVSYKYYNRNEPSEPLSDRYTAYLPKIKYDGLDQTDYNKYSSRYITSGSTTYFIISDLANPGRKVVPVYGSFSSLPSTISYNGVTYEVSLSEGESGWKQQGNDWYYYTAAGTPLKGWQKIKDEWYYLDPNTGAMKTGWLGLEGKWYYMIPSTGVMSTGWKQINNKWYFFDEEGVMVTGWKFSGGSYYYFNQDGDMVTGWKLINGKYYYFNNDGIMLTGWKHSGGSYYYLNQGGEMVTGWKYIGGKYYYFNTDGSMVTGWKPINGVWYYFNKDGDMATGWKYIDGAWYYLNSDGSMKTGWLSSGGHWYYLASNGKMLTGKQTIGGKTYDLGNDGILIENAA